MNRKPFKYAVLKYRPSYLLDEQVNVGILIVFPEDHLVEFLYPQHLQRLTHLFPDAELAFVRRYLIGFKNRAAQLSKKNLFVAAEKDNLITDEFLVQDATALFFTEWKSGSYRSPADLLRHFSQTYFSLYEEHVDESKHDEEYLKTQINQRLRQDEEKYALIKRDVILANNRAEVEFDFAWQNGKVNLVRTVGFDLKSREGILNKSHLWFGRLTNLRSDIEAKQAEVHFLLSKPRDPELLKSFDTALAVLKDIDLPQKIYLEKDIEDYVKYALDTLHPLPPTLF